MSWPYAPGTVVYGDTGDIFALVRKLGEGSSAHVYEAEDLRRGGAVALKLLRDGASSLRLHRERAALQKLCHPNIVRLHAFGLTRDRLRLPYLATTLLSGGSLRVVLTRHQALPMETALDYAIDLFEALAAAEEFDIAHRDVRPENAFIERVQPRVHRLVVHDFGLVCPAHGRFPTAQGLIGDLRYAAPELLCGGVPTFRTDLYAAGIVLHEMLTGEHPLGSHSDDWRSTHATAIPAPLDALLPDASPHLVALADRLVSKNARDRPSSAAECAHILRGIMGELLARTPNANTTTDDRVDSLLRRIAGPSPEEITQNGSPSSSTLRRARRRTPEADSSIEPPSRDC